MAGLRAKPKISELERRTDTFPVTEKAVRTGIPPTVSPAQRVTVGKEEQRHERALT